MDQPCQSSQCECNPCECDPCECAPRIPTPTPTAASPQAPTAERKKSPLPTIAEDEEPEQVALVQVVIAQDTSVPLDAASVAELKTRISGLELTPASIITVMRHAMEIVEGLTVKGDAQKDIAVALVKAVLEDAEVDPGLLAAIVEGGLIGSAIELVINATQGELAVNVRRRARRLCGC